MFADGNSKTKSAETALILRWWSEDRTEQVKKWSHWSPPTKTARQLCQLEGAKDEREVPASDNNNESIDKQTLANGTDV